MYGAVERAVVTACVLGLPASLVLFLYGVLPAQVALTAGAAALVVALLADRPWHRRAQEGNGSWDRLAGDTVHEDMVIMNRGCGQPPSVRAVRR